MNETRRRILCGAVAAVPAIALANAAEAKAAIPDGAAITLGNGLGNGNLNIHEFENFKTYLVEFNPTKISAEALESFVAPEGTKITFLPAVPKRMPDAANIPYKVHCVFNKTNDGGLSLRAMFRTREQAQDSMRFSEECIYQEWVLH